MGHAELLRKHLPLTSSWSSASRLSRAVPSKPPHVPYLQPLLKAVSVTSGESGERMMGSMARVGMVALLSWALVFPCNLAMAAEEEQPKNFEYFQIWASQDGETHIAECKMTGFNLTDYATSVPQYVRSDFGGEPIGFVLTELPVNFTQGFHSPPAVQFVTTLAGSWYVQIPPYFLSPQHHFSRQLLQVFETFEMVARFDSCVLWISLGLCQVHRDD